MKDAVAQDLRRLGRLKVSSHFKGSVLAGVISVQARQIRQLRKSRRRARRFLLGIGGRRLEEPEPIGFAPLPDHVRPVVESYYQFGGVEQ